MKHQREAQQEPETAGNMAKGQEVSARGVITFPFVSMNPF